MFKASDSLIGFRGTTMSDQQPRGAHFRRPSSELLMDSRHIQRCADLAFR